MISVKTGMRMALFGAVMLSMLTGCRSNRPPAYSYPDYSSRYTRQAREYEQAREKARREEEISRQKEEKARLEREKKAEKERKKAEEKRLAAAQRAARAQTPSQPAAAERSAPPAASPIRPAVHPAATPSEIAPAPARLEVTAPVARRPAPSAARPAVAVPPPSVPREPVVVTESRSSSGSSPYQLKAGDMVAIYLRGIPREEEIQDVVDENGYVTLTYINEVHAAGKTTSELERAIREAYLKAEIYKNISVNVVMQQQSYFVRGEVRSAGRFVLLSGTTLMQAIATAGGYTEFAQPKKVRLLRGGKSTIHDLKQIEKNPDKDISIEAEDVIVVPRSVF